MPHENVDIVRRIYARWREGDFKTVEHLDPDFLLVMRPEFPDSGSYLGLEALAEYMQHFLEPWDRITIEAEELIPVGDSIVAAVSQRGAGSGSGAATELRYFHLWTFRGGMAIRLETIREREEAFAAVGLSG
jgi:ketosteroid isomerase-like protein